MAAYRGILTGLTKSTDHPSIREHLGPFQAYEALLGPVLSYWCAQALLGRLL